MSEKDPVVIVGMARTPMGGLLGDLAGFSANELGAMAIRAAVAEAGAMASTVASASVRAASTLLARTGDWPMLVSATRASAMVPLSRRTAAATPTVAHA